LVHSEFIFSHFEGIDQGGNWGDSPFQNQRKAVYYMVGDKRMLAVQTANPPTFESVWAILDRVSTKQEELVASQKETDRIVKETAKQIGKLNNRFGEIVEYMVAPNLRE
jgi:hypothetical protein